jgi:hypothetical protein
MKPISITNLIQALQDCATATADVVKMEKKIDDTNIGGGQYGHPETDYDTGYNSALSDIESKEKFWIGEGKG